MKTRISLFFCLIVFISGVLPLAAQDGAPRPTPAIQESPEQAVKAYYDFLFTATPDNYDYLPYFLCPDYLFDRGLFEEIISAVGGASVDLSQVTVTEEFLDPDTFMGEVSIQGEPIVTTPNAPAITLPERLPVFYDGRWKVCPSFGRHLTVVRPADLALTEEDAFRTAVNFYNAFYTGNLEQVAALSCVEKRARNVQASMDNYGTGFDVAPSQWDLVLEADGHNYKITTLGDLELSFEGRTAIVPDRQDFLNPVMVRENGWKFCDAYRENEQAIIRFVRAYFSDTPGGEVILYVCEDDVQQIMETSQRWQINIESINIPEGLFNSVEPDVAEANNLQAMILLGSQVVSVGTEFGPRARLVRSANQWLWCQLPLDIATPEPTLETTMEATEEVQQ